MDNNNLKLIYILKIGYDSKNQGLYQFIFSNNIENIDEDTINSWGWNDMPANNNASAPDDDHVSLILSLTTNKIDLICLHELNDRRYIDGYYTIHALAYQDLDDDNSDLMYDELPILVFHYGMKLSEVKDILYTRDLLFKESLPDKVENNSIKSNNNEEDDDEYYDEIDIKI
jgi:hypothetical protein